MTDERPGPRPWDDERIPLGVPAESIYHRAVTTGISRRKRRRQRRVVAGVALVVAFAIPLGIVEASHASTHPHVEVTATPSSSTSTTARSGNGGTATSSTTPARATVTTGVPRTTPGQTVPVTRPSHVSVPPVTGPGAKVVTTVPTPTTIHLPPRTTTTLPRPTTTLASGPRISAVVFSGNAASPTVTVTGSGFGVQPTPSETNLGFCGGGTGFDFPPAPGGNYNNGPFTLAVDDLTRGWSAGRGDTVVFQGNCIGLVVVGWSPTLVQFGFGSAYGELTWSFNPGDQYRVWINGLNKAGNFSLS
jgi:hypothetical protein